MRDEICGNPTVTESGVIELCECPALAPGRFCVHCEFEHGIIDPHLLFRVMGVPERVIEGPHLHIADANGRVIGVAAPVQDDPNAEWEIREPGERN